MNESETDAIDLENLDLLAAEEKEEIYVDENVVDIQDMVNYYYDILDMYYNYKKKPDTIYKEAEEFFSMIHGEQKLYGKKNSKKPSLELLRSKQFSLTNFIPIVSDKKKYFTNNPIHEGEMTDNFKQFSFQSFMDKETSKVTELYVEEMLLKKYYQKSGKNTGFNYIDYYKSKYTGGTILNEDDEESFFSPLRLDYVCKKNIEMNKSFANMKLPFETTLMRDCINNLCITNPLNPLEYNPLNFIERKSVENQYVLELVLESQLISKTKIKSCNGTVPHPDKFYFQTEFEKKQFNSIQKYPPKKKIYYEGENVNMVGLLIKSPYKIQPQIISGKEFVDDITNTKYYPPQFSNSYDINN